MDDTGDRADLTSSVAPRACGEAVVSLEANGSNESRVASDTTLSTAPTTILSGVLEPADTNEADFELNRRKYHGLGLELAARKKRKAMGKPEDVQGFSGPWAGYEGEKLGEAVGPSEDELARHAHIVAQNTVSLASKPDTVVGERSIFHGKSERDYLGRTYMHPPADVDIRLDKTPGSFECFAPKRLAHTWSGHSKGVNSIRFLPGSGHLLLSASQDARVKLWSVYGDRKCIRTFIGHNKPVRVIDFRPDGARFLSASYDQTIKTWDTETGTCTSVINLPSISYCGKYHGDVSRPEIIMAGLADRRILQYDLRSGEIVLEFAQHLDAVNSITFFDDGKRFASTSDDKSIRVWDSDIPVTTKYIADPAMHSMPVAALHPEGEFMAFQSLDNHVAVYATERFQARRKKFVGHSTAGYACGLSFAPDGRFLASGDGRGNLVVWDWKTGQLVRRLPAHEKVCIDVAWHPQEGSKIATCSWDGNIKLWD